MKTHPSLPLLPTVPVMIQLIRKTAKTAITFWALLMVLPFGLFFAFAVVIPAQSEHRLVNFAVDMAALMVFLVIAVIGIKGFLAAIYNANTVYNGGAAVGLRDALTATKGRFSHFFVYQFLVHLPAIAAKMALLLIFIAVDSDTILQIDSTYRVSNYVRDVTAFICLANWLLAVPAIVIEKLGAEKAMRIGSMLIKGRIISMMVFTFIGYTVGELLAAGVDGLYWFDAHKLVELSSNDSLSALQIAFDGIPAVLGTLWLIVVLPPMLVVLFRTLWDLEAANTPATHAEVAPGSENKIDALDGSAANAGI